MRTIEKYDVDRIIHTAAMSHPDLSIDLPLTTVVSVKWIGLPNREKASHLSQTSLSFQGPLCMWDWRPIASGSCPCA